MKIFNQVMANEAAKARYLALENDADPERLADEYLSHKLRGEDADCIAIECHLRMLVQVRFDNPRVRQGLADMERHKARRKMGKNAPKPFQDIARQIEAAYACGTFDRLDDGRIRFYVYTGADSTLKITCKNAPGSVALVAAKYRRGFPKRRRHA